MRSRSSAEGQGPQPAQLPAATVQTITGINRFAFQLLAKLAKDDGKRNLFVSPLSIAIAFALVGHGAEGETRKQILETFGVADLSKPDMEKAFAFLTSLYNTAKPGVEWSMANSLWQAERDPVLPDFVADLQKRYAAESFNLDFNRPDAAEIINHWVSDKTKGKIDQLVTATDVAGATLALLNAVYFKANWQNQFDPTQTSDQPFTLLDGKTEARPLMRQKANFAYFEHELFQAIDLPYVEGSYHMAVILPRAGSDFAEFQRRFDTDDWQMVRSQFRSQQVQLTLPRFTIMQHQLLNEPMNKLGVKKAFNRNAEFPLIGKGLFISKVLHQATLTVNEEGAEAAAATAIVMSRSILSAPTEMRVDHPFLCILHDSTNGTILFAGYIVDPR
ncbi:MAG: serpin family protein [Caldilineaceae bacterium]